MEELDEKQGEIGLRRDAVEMWEKEEKEEEKEGGRCRNVTGNEMRKLRDRRIVNGNARTIEEEKNNDENENLKERKER